MGEIIKALLSVLSPMVLAIAAASIYLGSFDAPNGQQMTFGFAVMVATLWVTRDRRRTND